MLSSVATIAGEEDGLMVQFGDWLSSSWDAFLSANPFATFISAALGAFAGAIATSRRESKRAVIAELNSVNAARALCFSICAAFLNQKKQHTRDLKLNFDKARQAHIDAVQNAANAPIKPVIIEFKPNFGDLTAVKLPVETLESQVLNKTSATGRILIGAIQLITVIDCFNNAIKYRADLINDIRKNRPSDEALVNLYFGLPGPAGVDARYKDIVEAIALYNDDWPAPGFVDTRLS